MIKKQYNTHENNGKEINVIKDKRNSIYIATNDIRTDESLQELEYALGFIKWDIIGLSELRRMGEKIKQHENYILYHIGTTPGLRGDGFLIKKCYSQYIQSFIGISERIAQLVAGTTWQREATNRYRGISYQISKFDS